MTARRSLGGALDMAAYAALAQTHRPTDPAELAGEIRRLAATGLRARDISTALRLPHDHVVNASAQTAGMP